MHCRTLRFMATNCSRWVGMALKGLSTWQQRCRLPPASARADPPPSVPPRHSLAQPPAPCPLQSTFIKIINPKASLIQVLEWTLLNSAVGGWGGVGVGGGGGGWGWGWGCGVWVGGGAETRDAGSAGSTLGPAGDGARATFAGWLAERVCGLCRLSPPRQHRAGGALLQGTSFSHAPPRPPHPHPPTPPPTPHTHRWP